MIKKFNDFINESVPSGIGFVNDVKKRFPKKNIYIGHLEDVDNDSVEHTQFYQNHKFIINITSDKDDLVLIGFNDNKKYMDAIPVIKSVFVKYEDMSYFENAVDLEYK